VYKRQIFPEFWIKIFIAEETVVYNGITALRIISFGFIFYGLAMVLVQGFNGSGDTATPTKMNFFAFWMMEIPLAYFLAIILNKGLTGASISVVLSETFLAILALYLFRKGKWKLREV
jgi:Na+-driven multidrug efflux pump